MNNNTILLILIVLWSLPWKGVAMWHAAHRRDRMWFIAFLFIHTLGLLEIIYILAIRKKQKTKPQEDARESMVSFDEFSKIRMIVAQIISTDPVDRSDKLIKLTLDSGNETRHIIAGIGKAYNTDMLVGKQIVIVSNLEPKKIMGEESQGMLLAADADQPVLLTLDSNVKPGTRIG